MTLFLLFRRSPLAMTHALSKGEGRVQTMLLLFKAASSSIAPMAPGTCPASSGPEAALQFPHGRAISERWTKPLGQPTREKEKEKQIFIPSASHHRKEGLGTRVGNQRYIQGMEVCFKHSQRRGGDSNDMRVRETGALLWKQHSLLGNLFR